MRPPTGKTLGFLLVTLLLLPMEGLLSAPSKPLGPTEAMEKHLAESQQRFLLEAQLQQALGILSQCFGGPVDLDRLRTTEVVLTAYSSTPDQCDSTPHITASETPVRIGIVAVSDDLVEEFGLSFGQRILIPGHGLFEVRDRMNPRWTRRIDIWTVDRKAALLFGRQESTVIWMEAQENPPGSPILARR